MFCLPFGRMSYFIVVNTYIGSYTGCGMPDLLALLQMHFRKLEKNPKDMAHGAAGIHDAIGIYDGLFRWLSGEFHSTEGFVRAAV